MIKAVYIAPGTGENSYETEVIYKNKKAVNANVQKNRADVMVSLDKLARLFPHMKKVNLEVGWFGNTLDPSTIKIIPKVEHKVAYRGDLWAVGDVTRATAESVTLGVNKIVNWGGTPSDHAVLNLVIEMAEKRGYDVMITPIICMDIPNKPWMGDIKATDESNLDIFFSQYGKFIKHYANLQYGGKQLKHYIKDFSIGSELKGLTDNPEAISKFIDLAKEVKEILGNGIKVTYSANWAEYLGSGEGYRAIDKLWASESIDYVGINAFFPMTDKIDQESLTEDDVIRGWTSGKDYDYYVEDGEQVLLSPGWAIKDFKFWHENYHDEAPDGEATEWTPKMKDIVFTRYGFICPDSTTYEPYVCRNAKNSNSKAQGVALKATERFLGDMSAQCKEEGETNIAEIRYLNMWDARPNHNHLLESIHQYFSADGE